MAYACDLPCWTRFVRELAMPMFQDRIRRVLEQLRTLRSRTPTHSQRSLSHVAEALEELTQAIKNIEERLQALNEAKRPNGLARVGTKSAAP